MAKGEKAARKLAASVQSAETTMMPRMQKASRRLANVSARVTRLETELSDLLRLADASTKEAFDKAADDLASRAAEVRATASAAGGQRRSR